MALSIVDLVELRLVARLLDPRLPAALALLLVTSPLAAQEASGNAIVPDCAAPSNAAVAAWCRGYALGALEGASGMQASRRIPPVCYPDGVDAQQIVGFTVDWLRRNPGQRHYDRWAEFYVATLEVWPCAEDVRKAALCVPRATVGEFCNCRGDGGLLCLQKRSLSTRRNADDDGP